ncbi:hypothetical protein [Bacillus suaedae]|uniref:Uncharacterized protein n=1 Tax=Halalkalibacter suaedae TaxID=2822140 RepID=A0A940WY97_9BACI|nr:hypothetical protein [Bacillus suaedae]MBP3952967.1 hypothetical protein [Bacillus suaedae]
MSMKQKNTVCVIILSLLTISPVLIWLFTEVGFLEATRIFTLDYSIYFSILLGAVIVNYTMKSTKLLTVVMLAAVAGLGVYFFL